MIDDKSPKCSLNSNDGSFLENEVKKCTEEAEILFRKKRKQKDEYVKKDSALETSSGLTPKSDIEEKSANNSGSVNAITSNQVAWPLAIAVTIAFFIYLFHLFPKITLLILFAVILIFISNKLITRKKYDKKLPAMYAEYRESMKGKDTIKSYEEFEQETINLDKKTRAEYWEAVRKSARDSKSKPSSNIPKCPTCGSVRVEKISVATKFIFLGPFFPLYKTFKCKSCGYKW